jgi:hypothetical protein
MVPRKWQQQGRLLIIYESGSRRSLAVLEAKEFIIYLIK